jgi:hypothetical protein
MRIATSFVAAFFLIGSFVVSRAPAGAGEVFSKAVLTPDNYCRPKFPAIDEKSLTSNISLLKRPRSGDIIDFYGPCDEDLVGKRQQESQQHDLELRFGHSYSD